MADINSLLRQQASEQSPEAAPNPLAMLAGAGPAPQAKPPVPTAGQTAAALHHFSEIKATLKPIMADPKLGKENIRPKLLDSMSQLLASRTLSLPQVMNAIKALPEDPVAQFKFVHKVFAYNDAAQKLILAQHRSAQELPEEEPYSPNNHDSMMEGLLKQYKRD